MTVKNPYAAANALKIQADIFQSFGDRELSVLLKNNYMFLILSIVWCIFFLFKFSNNKNINSQ